MTPPIPFTINRLQLLAFVVGFYICIRTRQLQAQNHSKHVRKRAQSVPEHGLSMSA